MTLVSATVLVAAEEPSRDWVRAVLDATGVRGGLIVHLGCGDGRRTAALRLDDRYLVHGLDAAAENIDEARQHIRSLGLGGKVSVERHAGGRLPYAENLVNLLVAEQPGSASTDEIMRVLRPGGVGYVKHGGQWTRTTKPWPPEIDEWTHWQHGADGNAVAQDVVVGPPRRMQWAAGPLWSRHHDTMPSVSAMVSSAGRLFYIVDEAPVCAEGTTPDDWSLVARDAFNGIELWRVPLPEDQWGWKAWSTFWKGRFNQPNQIPKRLVAMGQRVYVTLGFNAPLSELDAAAGRIIRTYQGTDFTDEILYDDGTLILSINETAQKGGAIEEEPSIRKSVCAVDAETGKRLWTSKKYTGISTKTDPMERVTHLLLAARNGRVYLADGETIVALDRKSGAELWKSPRPEITRYTSRYQHLMSEMATLVATDDVVLFCQLEPIQKRIGWRVIKARLRAFSATTGEVLWDYACGNWGHFCVPDLFVAQGLVWVHDKQSMSVVGLDLLSGAERRRLSTELAFDNGHHHRCYRNKATERFLVTSFRGLEFIDWQTDVTRLNHWARGTCRLGVMPCNGMIYAPPHPCDCYVVSKLNGLLALAPAGKAGTKAESGKRKAEETPRLERGPAYTSLPTPHSSLSTTSAWPTYRHDAGRSGHTTAVVGDELKLRWKVDLKGRCTAATVADGSVFVAAADTHTVYALEADTGRTRWRYTAGGPIDVPPTIHDGLALFGSRDGHVYCLRADDGKLVWRFRAAPEQRLIGAFDRLESAWPVHGGVLIQDGVACVAAGRSSFLDGGIHVYRLDPRTGKVLAEETHASTHDMKVNWGRNLQIDTGVLADVLVGDGENVFMRQRRLFDSGSADLLDDPGSADLLDNDGDGQEEVAGHLRATAGMLDPSWFNRTAWLLDDRAYGDLLVHDEQTVYAVRQYEEFGAWFYFKPGDGYELVATERTVVTPRKPGDLKPNINKLWKVPKQKKWSTRVAVRPVAMVLTGETLFAAGTPDLPIPQQPGRQQPWAAHQGRRGGVLLVVSVADGRVLAQHQLDAAPVFDGLAAVEGRLFISTATGEVVCYEGL